MLNLDKYIQTAQTIKKGFMKKCTLIINGEKYFFKENRNARENKGIIPITVVEVIATEILKQLGAKNFINYNLATLNGIEGSLSKSFINENTEYCEITFLDILINNYLDNGKKSNFVNSACVDEEEFKKFYNALSAEMPDGGICDFSIGYICEKVSEFCKNNDIKFDINATEQRLKEMIVYDYFICNHDHNWTNINFIISDNKMELTPYFDYSESFDLFNKVEKNVFRPLIYSRIAFDDFSMGSNFSFSKLLRRGGNLEVEIYNFAKQDKNIANFVQKGLNLDIKLLIENVVKQENVNFPKEYIDYITNFYNFRINHYKKTISRLEKKIPLQK